jgi:hypothetical protein
VYPNLTPALVGLLGAALAVTAVLALRGPLARRLALRQVNRRRGEAALVVTGSVLGTAIIVGSFIVGDTFNFSIKQGAYDHLGVIDEVVGSPTPAQGEAAARRLAALAGDQAVLLANHGVVAVGPGLDRALLVADAVEQVAELCWRARCLGTPAVLPDAEMERVARAFEGYGRPQPRED